MRKYTIVIAATLASACAEGDEPEPTRDVGERVIDGEEDYLETAVGMLGIDCPTASRYCSATLIGGETVLTAAHCVLDPENEVDPDTCRFRFTAPHTGSIGVDEIAIHPRWKGAYDNFKTHDLAVLHLEGLALGAHTEVLGGVGPFEGDEIEVVGYGNAAYDDPSTGGVLRSAVTSVTEVADEYYGYTTDKGGSICNGDSGGPTFQRVHDTSERRLVGVHSSVRDECSKSFDTRIGAHLGWILEAGGDDIGCGGVDYTGYCAGSWVVWCDHGSLRTSDCSGDDRYSACGFVNEQTGYYCVEP